MTRGITGVAKKFKYKSINSVSVLQVDKEREKRGRTQSTLTLIPSGKGGKGTTKEFHFFITHLFILFFTNYNKHVYFSILFYVLRNNKLVFL